MSTVESTPPPAAQSKPSKTIVLRSSDGECFEVEESVALECGTIKQMIEDGCADSAIPLPNISSKILSKVIEYCNRHAHSDATATVEPPDGVIASDDLKKFDAEFLNVDQSTLFDLILGANFLEAKKLLDLTCQYVADMMKGKKPDEIRKMFNIENDFTPEEEEAIRKENPWAWE